MSCDMNDFYFSLPLSEQRRINSLQLFDEFEEWHSKCGHYMLLCAASGSCVQVVGSLLPSIPSVTVNAPQNCLKICPLSLEKDTAVPARLFFWLIHDT